jgi:hypothetical protein
LETRSDIRLRVWLGDAFSAHAVGRIRRNIGILRGVIKPSSEELQPDDDCMFQQDNDPKDATNINKDLNPIEKLWSILDQRLHPRGCTYASQISGSHG